jgi:hypothetical protein
LRRVSELRGDSDDALFFGEVKSAVGQTIFNIDFQGEAAEIGSEPEGLSFGVLRK